MVDISVIVTGHDEGRLIHRTFNSIFRSINFATKRGLNIEVILHLDAPTQKTLEYIDSSSYKKQLKILKSDFKDLGLSRNFSVSKAKGKYIAFIDGDDLFCENWLFESFNFAESYKEKAILHPEYLINFEGQNLIWKRVSSIDPAFRYGSLMTFDSWGSTSLIEKSLLKELKFSSCPLDSSWGYTNWTFACDTLVNGIPHIVVPKTVVFIRKKAVGGMTNKSIQESRVIGKNALFEFETLEKLLRNDWDSNSEQRSPSLIYKILNRFPRFYLFLRSIKQKSSNTFGYVRKKEGLQENQSSIPVWLYDEWKMINNIIEAETFPPVNGTEGFWVYSPEYNDLFAYTYVKMAKEIGEHVIIFPHIKVGGAEKVLFIFIKTLRKLFPKERITVITTEPTESPWRDRLPFDTEYLDIGNLQWFSDEQKEKLLTLLLVQNRPKRVYMHSTLGMMIYQKYGRALAEYSKLFVFIFSKDFDKYGRLLGYVSFFDSMMDYITGVLTDNTIIINFLCDTYGFGNKKFTTLYQPTEITDILERKYSTKGLFKILWASRLDRAKRPDIVYKIAKACQDLPIKIDMYGSSSYAGNKTFGSDFNIEQLKTLKNIEYKGPFSNGIKEVAKGYDSFLYTSEYDGMPNVILEAAGQGLPIIAPEEGGIPDLLRDGENALLVKDFDDISQYREKILFALNNRKVFNSFAKEAYIKLREKYSWKVYESTLKSVLRNEQSKK